MLQHQYFTTPTNKRALRPPLNSPRQQIHRLIRGNTVITGNSGPSTWVPCVPNGTGETAPAENLKQSSTGAENSPPTEKQIRQRSNTTVSSSKMCQLFDSNRTNVQRKIHHTPEQNAKVPNRAQSGSPPHPTQGLRNFIIPCKHFVPPTEAIQNRAHPNKYLQAQQIPPMENPTLAPISGGHHFQQQ